MNAATDLWGFLSLGQAPFIVLALIFVALAFDFSNGVHDSANSIATIVSTRVLSPRMAVYWAASFNFLAVFVFGTAVANTIGKGIVDVSILDYHIVFAALMGAILWNTITWYFGLPSSSSHALIGGLIGSGFAKAGLGALVWSGISKTLLFIVIAPVLGLVLGFIYMVALAWIFRRSTPKNVDKLFRRGQFISAALYSLGHGGNDAQKTAGIIFGILVASQMIDKSATIPFWVLLLCHVAMGLGTMFGGKKIIKTMGMKITKLTPVGGFAAETAGTTALVLASIFGIPVSTTHSICGSIVGVGSVRRLSAVRWGIAKQIIIAWIITIPAAALISVVVWSITCTLVK